MNTPTAAAAAADAPAIAPLLDALRTALAEELAALRARDVTQLEAAITHKAALIAELEGLTGKYCRPGQALPSAWQGVHGLAAQCAEANRAVGGAVALNRNLVARLIEITHGGRLATTTYAADGRVERRDATRGVGYA